MQFRKEEKRVQLEPRREAVKTEPVNKHIQELQPKARKLISRSVCALSS